MSEFDAIRARLEALRDARDRVWASGLAFAGNSREQVEVGEHAESDLRALLARVDVLQAERDALQAKLDDLLADEAEPPAWFTPEVAGEAEANIAAGRVYTLREVELREELAQERSMHQWTGQLVDALREALAAVVNDPPWDYNEHGDTICGWCGHTIHYNHHRDYPADAYTHAPDCAYTRARALLD